MTANARQNPYQSPTTEGAPRAEVALTFGQCCWKYGKLGAWTALWVMGSITLLITVLVVVSAIVIGPNVWRDAPRLVGGSLILSLAMVACGGVAGTAIGALLFAVSHYRRT